jgi:hypothetical protein
MIKFYNWKPDTCECQVEERHDTEIDGREAFTLSKVLKRCPVHEGLTDEELWDTIFDKENKVKNQMLRVLLGYEGLKLNLEESKKNTDGSNAGLGLKEGIEYNWSFEGTGKDRKLKVDIKGANLTQAQKTAIKTLCDTKFGVGKVEVL